MSTWDDVKAGDTISIIRNGTAVTGIVSPGMFGFRLEEFDYLHTLRETWELVEIHEVESATEPELPTEDGFYLDKEGDIWKLLNGEWEYMNSDNLIEIEAKNFAPFTRLVLEGVTWTDRDTKINALRSEVDKIQVRFWDWLENGDDFQKDFEAIKQSLSKM